MSSAAARTVLVTGGAKRLGKAVADALALAGWRVARSSHRPEAGADVVADLSRPGGADALFAAACAFFGGEAPAALVNNAALFSGGGDELFAVNFAAPARLAELMASAPRSGAPGAVVNVLDCRVLAPGFRPSCAYDETKAALLARTREDARRFAGVLRVNAVAPGPVIAPETVSEKAGRCPFGRPRPEDVASAVAYLLSATATTGCVVAVDGRQSVAQNLCLAY